MGGVARGAHPPGVNGPMDRQCALQAFKEYVSAYEPDNPRIALKIDHTLRVAALCERIAGSLELVREDVDLAWLLGLLHDIGRFEQVRRFDSYNDAATVDHAALGVEVLFAEEDDRQPLVRAFCEDDADDKLIRLAVGVHSAFRMPDGLDDRSRTMCQILRDADKVDILRVNCTCSVRDIYGVSESDLFESALSPECVDVFYQHSCIPRGVRQFPADVLLSHVCFAWEIVYDESLRIVREQGHLRQMLERRWLLPATQEAFTAMAAHMAECLSV